MRVILTKNISQFGHRGEIKEVKEGYAQNYLFPQKSAVPATLANVKMYDDLVKSEVRRLLEQQDKPRKVAGHLQGLTLSFAEMADDKGTFFAGITKEKICAELSRRGVNIRPKQIKLSQAIKTAGENTVSAELAPGVQGEIKIITKIKTA